MGDLEKDKKTTEEEADEFARAARLQFVLSELDSVEKSLQELKSSKYFLNLLSEEPLAVKVFLLCEYLEHELNSKGIIPMPGERLERKGLAAELVGKELATLSPAPFEIKPQECDSSAKALEYGSMKKHVLLLLEKVSGIVSDSVLNQIYNAYWRLAHLSEDNSQTERGRPGGHDGQL